MMINIDINNYQRIVVLSDLHIHSNKIHPLITKMLNMTNVKFILLGDLIDVGTKGSVGAGVYENALNPQQQLDVIKDLLYPHKNNILYLASSNHHQRVFNTSGIDLDKVLADYLEIPYSEHVNITLNIYNKITKEYMCTKTIFGTHGTGNSGTVGGVANNLSKLQLIADADIYLAGHTHKPIYFSLMQQNREGRFKVKHFISSGSALGYSGYAKTANLIPSPLCQVYIDMSDPNNIKPVFVFDEEGE